MYSVEYISIKIPEFAFVLDLYDLPCVEIDIPVVFTFVVPSNSFMIKVAFTFELPLAPTLVALYILPFMRETLVPTNSSSDTRSFSCKWCAVEVVIVVVVPTETEATFLTNSFENISAGNPFDAARGFTRYV